jgi:hypothetical protein
VKAGGKTIDVRRYRITDMGRQAIETRLRRTALFGNARCPDRAIAERKQRRANSLLLALPPTAEIQTVRRVNHFAVQRQRRYLDEAKAAIKAAYERARGQ